MYYGAKLDTDIIMHGEGLSIPKVLQVKKCAKRHTHTHPNHRHTLKRGAIWQKALQALEIHHPHNGTHYELGRPDWHSCNVYSTHNCMLHVLSINRAGGMADKIKTQWVKPWKWLHPLQKGVLPHHLTHHTHAGCTIREVGWKGEKPCIYSPETKMSS